MRAVNLLPLEARVGSRRLPALPIAGAGVGVLAATALIAGFVTANGNVDDREQELATLEQQIAESKRATKPTPDQSGLVAERDQRLTALNDVMTKRLAWDRVLREVSLVLPEDVWLNSLAAGGTSASESGTSEPEAAPTGGPAVTFSGFTYSQESVARLLNRLELVPNLTNVSLQKSGVEGVGSQQIYAFTILANINSSGGTP